ncbi:transposase DNA-binding-containing protein [Paraburkholderia youngii]
MSDANDEDDWASDEFGAAQLGNARLTQRFVDMTSGTLRSTIFM